MALRSIVSYFFLVGTFLTLPPHTKCWGGGGIFCLIWAKHPDHLPFLLGCTDTTELKAAVEHSILILQNMILSPFSSDILEEAKSWASTLRTFGEETEERGIL